MACRHSFKADLLVSWSLPPEDGAGGAQAEAIVVLPLLSSGRENVGVTSLCSPPCESGEVCPASSQRKQHTHLPLFRKFQVKEGDITRLLLLPTILFYFVNKCFKSFITELLLPG